MTDSQPESPRRQQILDAARNRFVQDGFAATPVSAIVAEAGIAQGTFYLYFKNKQELITELRREVVREYEHTMSTIAAGPGPVDERLARIIVAISVVVGRHVELERMFRQSGSGEASMVAAREGRRRMARSAAALIANEPMGPGDPVILAGFVVTLFDQILFEAHAYAPETVEQVVGESLRFTLRGLGTDPARVEALVARQHTFQAAVEAL